MRAIIILFCLAIGLVSTSVGATEVQDDFLCFYLRSSDPGDSLGVEDVVWSDSTEVIVGKVNDGLGELYVEIANSYTPWELVKWLGQQKGTELISQDGMSGLFDRDLNDKRMDNVSRLCRDKGLKRVSALSYISVPRQDTVTVRAYYVSYEQAKSQTPDTVYSVTLVEDSARWSVGFGGQLTPVKDGRRIMVPTVSLAMSSGNCELGLVGGYWPGDFDQKFFAGYLTWFPAGGKLGWRNQLVYASESIETLGAYVQQGYGPMTGLQLRIGKFSLHLTGGFQYFDRQRQDRRPEATVNLGLDIKTFSF